MSHEPVNLTFSLPIVPWERLRPPCCGGGTLTKIKINGGGCPGRVVVVMKCVVFIPHVR